MKIAYATLYDVLNQASWPTKHQAGIYGSGYYLAKTLTEASVFIDYLGPLKEKKSLITSLKFHIYHHLFGKKYYSWAEPLILNDFATRISQKLSQLSSDLILCPINVIPIANLECKQPIVLWTDTTLDLLIDYYPYLSNLCQETIINIRAMEQAALDKCKLIIYTSEWAAQGAVKTYGIAPSKIKVIPWGANIECDRNYNDIYSLVKSRNPRTCKLLFMGVDWVRKGGSVAFGVAKELNKIGLNTELTIVGCEPLIDEPIPSFVKSLGYVDKSTKEGSEKINGLFAESHFLILPTVADCSPFVIAEANSFGVPCLATNVGGIPTMIRDNFNGKVFSNDANIYDYCNYIVNLFSNHEQNEKLALSSFNEYQTRLNWTVAAQTAKKLFTHLL
jgi:glycosyltransferase involved in cell wall biosynthesis